MRAWLEETDNKKIEKDALEVWGAQKWMKTLARGLRERLDNDLDEIFKHGQYTESTWAEDFAQKLDKFTVFLGLTPYKPNGVFHRKISSISQKSILPVQFICPPNVTCTTGSCKPYHLSLSTQIRDIPQVQLIEGSLVYEKAYPLTGECTVCKTRYHPDHEAYTTPNSNRAREVFINSAQYLKIGTSLWVLYSVECITSMHLPMHISSSGMLALAILQFLSSLDKNKSGKPLYKNQFVLLET